MMTKRMMPLLVGLAIGHCQVNGQTQSCPRFRVVRGAGGAGGARYVNITGVERFAVTCCSNTTRPGFAQPNNRCPVFAERDGGPLSCLNAVPFQIAGRACAVVGARLCTDQELIGRCGTGTGCAHDARYIWSSTYDPACGVGNAPTASPIASTTAPTTRAPTQTNNCPGFKIQSGAGGVGGVGGDSPRYAGTSETHEVSCCSNIALPGFSPPVLNCPVYAERDGGSLTCLSSANWTFANAFCRANRARLCTNTELVLGCGANLGCSFNNQMIWSATPNPNCQSAPTQLPTTLQPTGAPTPFNSCPGYKIQSGRGGTGNSDDGTQTPRFAGLGELHETTCCSPSAIPGFAAPVGNCTVYSERDAGTNGINTLSCHSSVTWTTAWTACNSIGARLCTATELQNTCGRGLGCQSDAQMIWSSTLNPGCNINPPPTVAPATPAPTGAPSATNNCPGQLLMQGNSRLDPGQGRYAAPSERWAVTCCADALVANSTSIFFPPDPVRGCLVFSERDAGGLTGCFSDATYTQAVAFCSAVGARLCTGAEIGTGCGQGTGCQFDALPTWTSNANPNCNGRTATPTNPPTASPTFAPTPVNSCPGYMTQAGNGGIGGRSGDIPRFAGLSEMHGVTCCSDTAIADFAPPNTTGSRRCPVWSERDGNALGVCVTRANWSDAQAFCRGGQPGARLCTAQELIDSCGVGTGCQHDLRMIWSSTANPFCGSVTASPTVQPTAPTMMPTRQPTPQAACPGYRVSNGAGGFWPTASGEPSRYAAPAELHEVTCCSDTSLASFSPPRNATITYPNGTAVVSLCPVWAERDFGQGGAACGRSLSYADAVTFCSAQSARLCTQPELEASCGSTLGCGHNDAVIWSSTANPFCNGITAPPTRAPTTLAPTDANSCPGVRIQWGRGGPAGPIGGDSPRFAALTESHAVTCCSDTMITGFRAPINDCPVFAVRDGGGVTCLQGTFAAARNLCLSAGARLCTAAELVVGCGTQTGCGHDTSMIWSSSCNPQCLVPCIATQTPSPPPTQATPPPSSGVPTSMVMTASPVTLAPIASTPTVAGSPTVAPSGGASGSSGSSDSGGGTSMSLIIIVVILVLSVGVAIPAAIWYLKKPSGGGGDAAVSHIKVGFENPMYGEGEKSYVAESSSDDAMYANAGEVEESGYMDVAGDEDNDDV
eukprot:m.368738 g.368738  ORF g.368738 m.368738 type:complete len:1171 (-) comp28116_c0_seq8:190-3702(-)